MIVLLVPHQARSRRIELTGALQGGADCGLKLRAVHLGTVHCGWAVARRSGLHRPSEDRFPLFRVELGVGDRRGIAFQWRLEGAGKDHHEVQAIRLVEEEDLIVGLAEFRGRFGEEFEAPKAGESPLFGGAIERDVA